MSAWIENEFFKLSTPIQAPKTFRGFVWLASTASCKKCSRQHTQALRIHQVQLPGFLGGVVIHKPMPSEAKLAASFMLRVCDNAVGCWKTCRPFDHMKVCLCPGECGCERAAACVCPKGCGNRGIHPCQCGRMFAEVGGKHRQACPVGLYKRVSSFAVDTMRSQMTGPGKGRK